LAKAAIEPSANYNLETMLMSKEIYDEIENFSSLKNAPSLLSPTAASPSSMMVQEIPVNTADSKSSLIVSAQSIPTTASMVKYQEEDLLDPEPLYGPYYSKGPIYTRKELMNALNKGELIPDTMYADDDIPPIITAAVYHDKEVIECLIKNGLTYIDEADEVKETALHKAARAGNLDLANYLIEKKLCLESKDFKGNTPLMTAIQFNHMAIIELFFNNNADITGKNKKKESVLVQAINAGNPAVVDLLITGNVPSSRKVNGFTPLEFAQEKCNQLPMHELISETGKNLKSIICSLTRYAKEKSDTAFAKLEAEEDSIVQKKARKQLAQQIAQTEKALLPTRAQLFPILAIRCKLALNKTATQDSSHYMNSQDKPFKILLIIAKQLGLEEEKPTLKLLKAPSSVQPSALKASMSNTKKTKKTLQTIIK
jgi:hypothetical protein